LSTNKVNDPFVIYPEAAAALECYRSASLNPSHNEFSLEAVSAIVSEKDLQWLS